MARNTNMAIMTNMAIVTTGIRANMTNRVTEPL